MTQNKKIPKLRFPEFSDQWETKTLGEVCEINPKIGKLPRSFIYIDLESVVSGLLIKEKNILKIDAPSRAQRVLEKKDILFQMVRPYQKNNLFFEKNGNYVASTGYAQIRTKQNPQFIFQHLHNQKFIDEVILNCSGTTYPAINSTNLKKIKISLPTLPEQQKIATFFSLLDKRIENQRQKVKNAEQLLKGFSQQLFSQQLRFKDENGKEFPDWETKALREVMSIPEKIKVTNIDKNKLLTVKLHQKGVCKNENTKTLKIGTTNYFIRKKGQFIYGKQNLFNGAFYTIPDKLDGFYSSADVPALDINHSKINAFYLLYFLGRKHFYKQLEWMATGTGSKRIHEKLLLGVKISLPTLAEQQKIASFLSLLDKKVENEKKLVKNLEQQKKYFLQNMFV